MTKTGLRSLEWLMTIQRTPDGYFAPVGTDSYRGRGVPTAAFDQQPVEACASVSACMRAFQATADPRWTGRARGAFSWFLGQNQLQQSLYDAYTGGCRDALHADRMNENQGAESTLSFLMALMDMRADQTRQRAEQLSMFEPQQRVMAVHALPAAP